MAAPVALQACTACLPAIYFVGHVRRAAANLSAVEEVQRAAMGGAQCSLRNSGGGRSPWLSVLQAKWRPLWEASGASVVRTGAVHGCADAIATLWRPGVCIGQPCLRFSHLRTGRLDFADDVGICSYRGGCAALWLWHTCPHPYACGSVRRNLEQVLGHQPWLWLLPCRADACSAPFAGRYWLGPAVVPGHCGMLPVTS